MRRWAIRAWRLKRARSTRAVLNISKWFQSRTAIPKSKSRLRRPGGLPKTCLIMTSLAIAPARKYLASQFFAISSIFLIASRTVGSIQSCLISKGGLNVFTVDHPSGFEVAPVCCCRKISVGEDWWHDIANCGHLVGIPEYIQNLDISAYICPHFVLSDDPFRRVPHVHSCRLRLKMVK